MNPSQCNAIILLTPHIISEAILIYYKSNTFLNYEAFSKLFNQIVGQKDIKLLKNRYLGHYKYKAYMSYVRKIVKLKAS